MYVSWLSQDEFSLLPLAKVKFLFIRPIVLRFPAHMLALKAYVGYSDWDRQEGSGHSLVIVMIILRRTSFPAHYLWALSHGTFRYTKPSVWWFGSSFLLSFKYYFAKCLSFVLAFYHLTDISFFFFFGEPFVYCHKLLFWLPALALNFVYDVSLAPTMGGHLPFSHLPGSGSACVCVGVLNLSLKENHIKYFIPFNAVVGLFILWT